MKISFACGLLGKCHSLSAEQRGPVSVMHHLETGVGANLSQYCHILMGCRNLTAKPTEREREWSLPAFSVNLFFQVLEKSESGANPPADIVVWGGSGRGSRGWWCI